jgi:hypothetical protein
LTAAELELADKDEDTAADVMSAKSPFAIPLVVVLADAFGVVFPCRFLWSDWAVAGADPEEMPRAWACACTEIGAIGGAGGVVDCWFSPAGRTVLCAASDGGNCGGCAGRLPVCDMFADTGFSTLDEPAVLM